VTNRPAETVRELARAEHSHASSITFENERGRE